MPIFGDTQRLWLWKSGYSNPNSKINIGTPRETYKPRALRIPSLLCLFFLFCISFTALELLLDRTVKPSEFYNSHGLKAPEKRQLSAAQCPSPEENGRILESLLQRQSSLCITYTTTFKPSTTDLSPPMQMSFDLWLASYSAMEAQLEFAESCATSDALVSSLSSLLATATATRVTLSSSLSTAQDKQVSPSPNVQTSSLNAQSSSQTNSLDGSTVLTSTKTLSATPVSIPSVPVSITSVSVPNSSTVNSAPQIDSTDIVSSNDASGTPNSQSDDSIPQVSSSISSSTNPSPESNPSSILSTIIQTPVSSSASSIAISASTSAAYSSSSSSTNPSISSLISGISSNITSIPTTTSLTISSSSTLSSPIIDTSATACTELHASCSACGYDYCFCGLSDNITRKRRAPLTGLTSSHSGDYRKRQSGLVCKVNTCYCPWSEEVLDYVCDAVNVCNQTNSSTTPDSSISSATSTFATSTSSLNSSLITNSSISISLPAISNVADPSAIASFESTPTLPPTSTTNTSTTSSSPTQPVCTETGTPCFECGQDYCLCGESDCEVDLCHCSISESGNYTCNAESTCQEPSGCENEGDTCSSCGADFCTCQPSSILTKRQTSLICTVDTCHCQWNSTSQSYLCDASANCDCPIGNDGQTCFSCEGSDCMCQAGQCIVETCTPAREGLSCSCEGGYCSCMNETCAYTCFNAPDGEWCDTCDSEECICSEQSCVASSTLSSSISSMPEIISSTGSSSGPTSSSSIPSSSIITSPTTSFSSPTQESHLPGATCNPATSHTCHNCVADRCVCKADYYCYPDVCYCDQIGPSQWSCGTIDRCNPDACDTAVLQCSGCNTGNSTALCTCSSEGICEPVTCSGCEFNDSGTELNCPVSCYTKRSISFNESTTPMFKVARRADFRIGQRWGFMDKRQGIEILTGNFQTPLRDAWNYLLWTEPLTIRRTSSSVVSTATAATFTLDVFDNPRSTSWPSLASTPPLAYRPTVPACIPATLIAPAPFQTTILKRDVELKAVKPYVTRESTTVVVRIRDNYLQMTSNLPTITRQPSGSGQASAQASGKVAAQGTNASLLYQMETVTLAIESTHPNGQVDTQSVVVIQPSTARTGDGPLDTGAPSGPDRTALTGLSDNKRVVQAPFTRPMYFAALYLPALMAVTIKILYETIAASIKMMEPFERLHREEGSSAEDSLSSEYLSSSLSFDVIKSIWSGRSIPLWTVIIYVLITVAAPLSSASMTVRPMDRCLINNTEYPCMPAWIVDLREIRILEAFLAICMALTLVLAWDSWNYHAGVPSNPTSIASMAVLLNYEPLRSDLQHIKPNATDREMSKALQGYHFWLLPHYPSRVQTRYGIIHSPISSFETSNWMTKVERLRKIFFFESRGVDVLHLITTLALLALLTTYRANLRNDAFNYFFASSGFWPKFILVGLATIIDMQWKNLEREVRVAEPYRRLYKGGARPENTILWPMNGTCWSNLPRCVTALFKYDGMWFEAIVGVTAIVSDLNIIAVAGVLMSYSQTKEAYEWSSITALICTGSMLFVLVLTMVWWRRSVRMLPRKPETIAAVLSYLCTSRMAMDFANMKMENMNSHERDDMIIALGRRYRFGLMMGEDGQERYCVDYDDDVCDDGSSERDRWLQEKSAAPTAMRLSM